MEETPEELVNYKRLQYELLEKIKSQFWQAINREGLDEFAQIDQRMISSIALNPNLSPQEKQDIFLSFFNKWKELKKEQIKK